MVNKDAKLSLFALAIAMLLLFVTLAGLLYYTHESMIMTRDLARTAIIAMHNFQTCSDKEK